MRNFALLLLAVSVAIAQPAPKRDLTGIWTPENPIQGIQPNGPFSMPADNKPEHQLPYTAAGLAAFKKNHPSNGPTEVAAAEENDPAHVCDPQGFPRENFFELRATQFLQTPVQVVMLYTYNKVWRNIWTDGRALPKDPDPSWFGNSVGKWVDDSNFVITTNGTDARTWLDNSGRPHSEDLVVEERYHRMDQNTMELTTTVNDPTYYTRPWVAQDKLKMRLLPPTTQIPEMMCSPSEIADYNKKHASRGGR